MAPQPDLTLAEGAADAPRLLFLHGFERSHPLVRGPVPAEKP